jgi:3-hydroxyisobutyrate dehydrogenase-like beta-hydroxyacid dehydrogenase
MEDKTVGFVGVGVMGGPMARRLIEAGYRLVVNDTNAEATAGLVDLGAESAATPKAVADRAAIVLTSLPSPTVFRLVSTGASGLIAGDAIRIQVDLSTVGSSATFEVAQQLAARQVGFVDAPVSGGAEGARKGTLSVMLAGAKAHVEAVRPLLAILGKLIDVSERPGHAQLTKLLNNMLSSTAFAVTAEAYVAGVRAGLDPQVMMDVFNAGSGRNGATADKFPKYVLPRSFDFGFPISSVCKDIGLAVEECQALGVPMWVGGQARQLWQSAYLQDGAEQDMTALVRFVERWSAGGQEP